MRFYGQMVIAKSISEMYDLEERGDKPNTLRWVTEDELVSLIASRRIQVLEVDDGDLTGNLFTRDITNVVDVTNVVGGILPAADARLVIISWDKLPDDDWRS